MVQSQSTNDRYIVETEQIENLPITRGNFINVVAFTPGVITGDTTGGFGGAGATRLGGAGQNNIMMDGISSMDTGNNGQMLRLNTESIGEVKILTQGYQAEFGQVSGLQITAVTKSGSNQFRESLLQRRAELETERERLRSTTRTATPNQSRRKKTGAIHSAAQSEGQAARTNSSSSTATNTVRATTRSTTATRSVCACRPRSSAPAISRRVLTTTARRYRSCSIRSRGSRFRATAFLRIACIRRASRS